MENICKELTDCTGCGACANSCGKSAITMQADSEGFLYPAIDQTKCIDCGLCVRVCPVETPVKKYPQAQSPLAVVSKSESVRAVSSSGGVFSLLSEWVLSLGGSVYGAMFDSEYNLYHAKVESEAELAALRGSKYAQSDVRETYKSVKYDLLSGRTVLYTGTPCQIAGLRNFLGKTDTAKLLTADIVCHGTPSIKMFNVYLEKLANGYRVEKLQLKDFHFRDTEAWGYAPSFSIAEMRKKVKSNEENAYMLLFLSSRLHRKSCYSCRFTTPERLSDITMADFWGIGSLGKSHIDTTKGCSLVLLNTSKGKFVFEQIKPKIDFEERTWAEALKFNHQLHKQSKLPKDRDAAIRTFFNEPLRVTYIRYFNTPRIRFNRFCGTILRKLKLLK